MKDLPVGEWKRSYAVVPSKRREGKESGGAWVGVEGEFDFNQLGEG